MIFIAVPGESRCGADWPAAISPTTGRLTGALALASATSAARTAYPSIAVLSKRGRLIVELMSSQIARSRASRMCWLNGGSCSTQLSRYS